MRVPIQTTSSRLGVSHDDRRLRSLRRTHLVPHLGELDLEKVKPQDIERMVGRMRKGRTGPKTVVNVLALLDRIFDHGRRAASGPNLVPTKRN
jgi:hypothetical protein